MTLSVTAGAKFYVGTTTPCTTLIQFTADTWTEVKEVKDLGDFGDSATEIKFETIGDSRVHKYRGTQDAGDMTLVCGSDALDPGQIAMLAASRASGQLDYNFKVVLDDAPSVTGTPSSFYFAGKIMSASRKLSSANNVVETNFKIGINSAILEVPAALGA